MSPWLSPVRTESGGETSQPSSSVVTGGNERGGSTDAAVIASDSLSEILASDSLFEILASDSLSEILASDSLFEILDCGSLETGVSMPITSMTKCAICEGWKLFSEPSDSH